MNHTPAARAAGVCVLTLLLAAASSAARGHPSPSTRTDAAPPARAERLRYSATWNMLPVANAELLVQPAGRDAVVLRGRAETNEALDLLWRMRDSFEATVRLRPIAPSRFVLRQNENDRRRDTTIVASPPHLLASVERRRRPTRRAEVALAPSLHDPASVAYAIRGLAGGSDARTYDVLAGTKIYSLTVTPSGTESVEVAGRTWSAQKFQLALRLVPKDVESRSDAAAEHDGGGRDTRDEPQVQEAELWISSGPERVPLRMRSRTFWGWVAVELSGRGA